MKKTGFRELSWRSAPASLAQNSCMHAGLTGPLQAALRPGFADSGSTKASRAKLLLRKAQAAVRARDVLIQDGAALRRFHISSSQQIGALCAFFLFALAALFGATQLIAQFSVAGPLMDPVARMRVEVAQMRADMAHLRTEAEAHAARLEQRQAMLDSMAVGGAPGVLPAAPVSPSAEAAPIIAPLKPVEQAQAETARRMRVGLDAQYVAASTKLARAGFDPSSIRMSGVQAMGGPYEPVTDTGSEDADPEFRQLFLSWQRLDQLQRGSSSIPSIQPVDHMVFTSQYGVRSDPFRGGAAMHSGVDIPGPVGSSVYATADGVVSRAGWSGGYGNLVELGHGGGIQTRYGHLSAILVAPGQFVKKGQLIGRMGSTGRSTGSHLHYEVRLQGQAVNPMAFLQPGARVERLTKVDDLEALGGPGN